MTPSAATKPTGLTPKSTSYAALAGGRSRSCAAAPEGWVTEPQACYEAFDCKTKHKQYCTTWCLGRICHDNAKQPAAGNALLNFLAAPSTISVIKAKGLEPAS